MSIPEIILPWPAAELSPNARVHWRTLSDHKKRAKRDAFMAAKAAGVQKLDASTKLTLHYTFCPPAAWRTGDDDNMIARCKAYRDGLAQALGMDDRNIKTAEPTWGERGAFVIAQFRTEPTGGEGCPHCERVLLDDDKCRACGWRA